MIRRFDMQGYSLGENNADVVTRVTVIGRNSITATAINNTLEDDLGIINEKVLTNNWDLGTHADCEVRARAILKQQGSSYTEVLSDPDDPDSDLVRVEQGFRTVRATLTNFPSYTNADGIKRFLREGDVALVSIRGELTDVPHIVHEISYGEQEGKTTIILSRDNLMNTTSDSILDTLSDSISGIRRDANAAGWSGQVPSERSVNQIIWHETVGIYEPLGRIKFNVEDTQRIVDFDDFKGNPSTDIVPEENWQTNLRIKQDDGGAILFRGFEDTVELQTALH